MMAAFDRFHISSGDWRGQLRINNRRTKMVIFIFILMFMLLGFIIDLIIANDVYFGNYRDLDNYSAGSLFTNYQPYGTIGMAFVAIIAIFIAFHYHSKIMLMGSEYELITSSNTDPAEKQLYNIVEEMKIASGMKFMPKVYVMNAEFMNAFASGFDEKSAMIAITRGLLTKLDRDELSAVVAHEISHIRHQDIKLTMVASILSNIVLIVIDILFRNLLYGSRTRRGGGGLVAVILILRFVLPIVTFLLLLYLSRTREYMADAGSVELLRDNKPLAHALIKIETDYRGNATQYTADLKKIPHEGTRRAAYIFDPCRAGLRASSSFSSFFSTHPSLLDRLKAIGFEEKK